MNVKEMGLLLLEKRANDIFESLGYNATASVFMDTVVLEGDEFDIPVPLLVHNKILPYGEVLLINFVNVSSHTIEHYPALRLIRAELPKIKEQVIQYMKV